MDATVLNLASSAVVAIGSFLEELAETHGVSRVDITRSEQTFNEAFKVAISKAPAEVQRLLGIIEPQWMGVNDGQ